MNQSQPSLVKSSESIYKERLCWITVFIGFSLEREERKLERHKRGERGMRGDSMFRRVMCNYATSLLASCMSSSIIPNDEESK